MKKFIESLGKEEKKIVLFLFKKMEHSAKKKFNQKYFVEMLEKDVQLEKGFNPIEKEDVK